MSDFKRGKLIINADDYGLSDKFNKGIIELADKKIISSTSVLIDEQYINPEGIMRHSASIGLHLNISDSLKKSGIEREIKRQIKKFEILFGKPPSHLDGHNNCHLLPRIFPKVLKVAKRHNLPVRSTNNKNRDAIKKAGIKTPSRLVWWNIKYKHILFRDLREKCQGATELLCHPGYYDPKSKANYNRQREKELTILKSKEFKKLIESLTLINYHELREL